MERMAIVKAANHIEGDFATYERKRGWAALDLRELWK